MNFKRISMKNLGLGTLITAVLLILVGLVFITIPASSGKDAMFVGEKYIGLVEKLPGKYENDLKNNMVEIVLNNKYNAIYNTKKDSLEAERKQLQYDADSLFRIRKAKEGRALEKEAAIIDTVISMAYEEVMGEKFSVDDEKKASILKSIKDTLSIEKYYGQLVSGKLGTSYTWNDFEMKKVQKQDAFPFIIGGLSFVIVGLLIILFGLNILNSQQKVGVIGAGVLVLVLVFVVSKSTFSGIDKVVQFEKLSKTRDLDVRENLTTLRDAQKQYKKYKGKFAGNFDSLVLWLKQDSVQQKKQVQINDSTMEESISMVPAIEVVFPAGKFPNLNVDSLIHVPHTDTNKFIMKAATVQRNGVVVPVFEISTLKLNYLSDIVLENFDKTSIIEIGDLDKPSYNGNWGE